MNDSLFSLLLAPLEFPFMLRAIGMAALVGTVCALLSCFLVLKKWSLMGDAISHAVLPGIVLAYWFGWPLLLGAFLSAFACALLTGFVKNHSNIKEDTSLGVIFTGLFGLGLLLVSITPSDIHFTHILFGSLLGISQENIGQTAAIGLLTLVILLAKRKDFLLYCFDPSHARTMGLHLTLYHYLLLILLASTVTVSIQAVGVILVVAMLITPGATAYLLTDRFDHMLGLAVASAVFSATLGTYLSYFLDGASGACIVTLQGLLFLTAVIFAPKYGLIAKRTASITA